MLYSPQAVPGVFDTAVSEPRMWREGRLEGKFVWCRFKLRHVALALSLTQSLSHTHTEHASRAVH